MVVLPHDRCQGSTDFSSWDPRHLGFLHLPLRVVPDEATSSHHWASRLRPREWQFSCHANCWEKMMEHRRHELYQQISAKCLTLANGTWILNRNKYGPFKRTVSIAISHNKDSLIHYIIAWYTCYIMLLWVTLSFVQRKSPPKVCKNDMKQPRS